MTVPPTLRVTRGKYVKKRPRPRVTLKNYRRGYRTTVSRTRPPSQAGRTAQTRKSSHPTLVHHVKRALHHTGDHIRSFEQRLHNYFIQLFNENRLYVTKKGGESAAAPAAAAPALSAPSAPPAPLVNTTAMPIATAVPVAIAEPVVQEPVAVTEPVVQEPIATTEPVIQEPETTAQEPEPVIQAPIPEPTAETGELVGETVAAVATTQAAVSGNEDIQRQLSDIQQKRAELSKMINDYNQQPTMEQLNRIQELHATYDDMLQNIPDKPYDAPYQVDGVDVEYLKDKSKLVGEKLNVFDNEMKTRYQTLRDQEAQVQARFANINAMTETEKQTLYQDAQALKINAEKFTNAQQDFTETGSYQAIQKHRVFAQDTNPEVQRFMEVYRQPQIQSAPLVIEQKPPPPPPPPPQPVYTAPAPIQQYVPYSYSYPMACTSRSG